MMKLKSQILPLTTKRASEFLYLWMTLFVSNATQSDIKLTTVQKIRNLATLTKYPITKDSALRNFRA